MCIIKSLSAKEILVHFPEENKTIEVERYEWQNIRYKVNENTKEIEDFLNSLIDSSLGNTSAGTGYVDDFMRRNPSTGALSNTNPVTVNVLIDPKDLTTVVTSGQQNETASGIVVGTSRINKYPGGTGF
jgi:hypothetical protein